MPSKHSTGYLNRYIPWLILLSTLAVYWYTANPLPAGYADSDELATTGYLLSVAHPPGYGLNTILIGLFQRLTPLLTPAHAANLFAGLLHTLTLVLLYKSALLITGKITTCQKIILALATVAAGLNSLFWLYSGVIEVTSLGNLFMAGIIYLTIRWATNPKADTLRAVLTISLITGAGIGHLQTIVLILPALLIMYVAKTYPQNWLLSLKHLGLALVLVGLGFILSSALILPLNARQTAYAWDFPQTLAGWWHMVSRQDYSGAFLDRDLYVENPYIIGFDWTFIDKLPTYLIATWNHYAGLPTLLILIGVLFILKYKSLPLLLFLASGYIVAGLLFGTYVTIADYDPTDLHFRLLVGTAERQYLIGYTILNLFFILGVFYLTYQKTSTLIRVILPLILILSMGIANFPMADQRHNDLVYKYNQLLLESAAPDAVIICASDFACFGLYYQSIVENKRPDVTVLAVNTKARRSFLRLNPQFYTYLYPENPSATGHLITHNLPKRPIYMTSISQFDIQYYGFDGDPLYANPENYLTQISLSQPEASVNTSTDTLINQILNTTIDHRDFHLLGFRDYLASYFQVEARYRTKYGFTKQAAQSLDKAIVLNPNDPRVIDWRLRLHQLVHSFSQLPTEATAAARFLSLAQEFETAGDLQKAEIFARRAHYLDPDATKPLEYLLRLYQDHDYPLFADWTRQHLRVLTGE